MLKSELKELDRLIIPWAFILWGSSLSMVLIQMFVARFDTHNVKARVCFFIAWHAHTLPHRLILRPRALRADTNKPDLEAPPYAQKNIHRVLGFMLHTFVFVISTAAQHISLATLSLILGLGLVFKHGHAALWWRYPSSSARTVDLVAKVWISLLSFASHTGLYVVSQRYRLTATSNTAWQVFFGGLAWPVLRHAARLAFSLLLMDPHGRRGTVRVFTAIALDLPVLICINIQDSIEVIWVLVICLSLVDSVASACFCAAGVGGMFSRSNLLWVSFISLSFTLTLKGHTDLTTWGVMQRVWFSVFYLVTVMFLPSLLLKLTSSTDHADEGPESLAELEQLRAQSWLPTLHPEKLDVPLDGDLDFSEEAIPASRHVMELITVVAQTDSVCFSLWGVYHAMFFDA